ncbi:MAG TPA: competence/damage-inducible protein A [Planctomycetota bacterium]|nr:competence/damage-inducible protein A [Planctomycetota bacterium]
MIHDVRKAATIAIGNELVEGRHADTNSGEISAALAELGIEVAQFVVVGDDVARLERVFRELTAEFQIVIATGGLGPTLDDVTREAAALAAGVPLALDPAALAHLQALWATRGRPMPLTNERQAQFPVGAQIMANPAGTAPGFRVWIDGGVLAALPGPPREMRPMLEHDLLPWIRATCGVGPAICVRSLYLCGLPESEFADVVGAWMDRSENPRVDVTAHAGVLSVKVVGKQASQAAALASTEARAEEVAGRFGPHVFSRDDPRLEVALAHALLAKRWRIAFAESCTGGGLAHRLTAVPGASEVLRESWITYSNESKVRRLGVPAELLEAHGAVSREVAEAMAQGALRESGADVAISCTGIAGPDGGSAAKPVGLVIFGVATRDTVSSHERRFAQHGRDAVRAFAVHTGLELAWRAVSGRELARR